MQSLIALTVCLLALLGNVGRTERPNIVIFLSDDHTWRDSSPYGSTEIKTPHMERIANAGMTFDRAYFPAKLKSWPEVLMEHGWHMGITDKGWGPGIANDAQGKPRG